MTRIIATINLIPEFPSSCDDCNMVEDITCRLFGEDVMDDDGITQRCEACIEAEKQYLNLAGETK